MFRVQIDTLDISLKGQVLCSLMLPFYIQPAVGAQIIVVIWGCASSWMLSHLLDSSQYRDTMSHSQQTTDCQEGDHKQVFTEAVTSVKFQLFCASVQTLKELSA